ncbi:MAG: hypothetical protein ACD_81C00026G0001 [uncultured bacterium]|uniref:Uncharacterized protein n=2 Tax=Candidatus Wolfeibacteriota TaxID=1752735 RepID=A0A0G1H7E3_9BACT|nr:MAG: hypothetical protein ACD_81C00026G0001 [uncultured bacterium]KKR13035.1 MAG: hypothetical protein UT41_C0001G0579 [Candidatus Wolfebacteria bacterium GW2011_GWC2_39_22]KKT42705.1 MAG: hypothetical protein UW32_C0004G0010 [Candidatus Wolfebacteria bacterium GW2011_GWE2_44_13]HBI26090.1 hypothetical protein [Candidatus Wolfebacteria bacterium]
MLEIVKEEDKHSPMVVFVGAGDLFYAKKVMRDEWGDMLVTIENLPSGILRLRAKKDLLAVVSGIWDIPTGVDHVLFLRAGRKGAGGVRFNMDIAPWRRLAAALYFFKVGARPIEAGAINALIYDDEIVVPHNSVSGWVIKRDDALVYIAAYEKARMGCIRVWYELRSDSNGEETFEVLIEGWNEAPGRRGLGEKTFAEYRVLYREKDSVIMAILLTDLYVEDVPVSGLPNIKSIAVGKRLPANLR